VATGSVFLEATFDEAHLAEVVEHAREGPRVRAGRSLEFVEALFPVQEFVEHRQTPLGADLLEGGDDGTGVVVCLAGFRLRG